MESSTVMSLSHQKLADSTVATTCCLGSPHGPCSQCKMEVAFDGFTNTDFHAKSEPAKPLRPFPKAASLGDGHRCKRFPCPVCHPGRSRRDGVSTAVVTARMLEFYARLQQSRRQEGVLLFGDGGHVCRRFPCPICGRGGRSAALEVTVAC